MLLKKQDLAPFSVWQTSLSNRCFLAYEKTCSLNLAHSLV